jgi:hypothetical protein
MKLEITSEKRPITSRRFTMSLFLRIELVSDPVMNYARPMQWKRRS